jgi:hypothetical protein
MESALSGLKAGQVAILQMGSMIMSKIDDLNSAIAGVKQDFADYDAAVQKELEVLRTAHEEDDTDAVEASVANINDLRTSMRGKIDGLNQLPNNTTGAIATGNVAGASAASVGATNDSSGAVAAVDRAAGTSDTHDNGGTPGLTTMAGLNQ